MAIDLLIRGEYSMSITRCKSQQQTLSIRVSDSLREFLELAREFITDGRGEAFSISDVAKLLLESARQDRLDFRLEAAELQQSPTASLLHIRRKWEQQQALSGPSGCSLPNTCRSPAKRDRGTRSPPARALSSRFSKHCSRCAPSGPTAVVALTDSTWETSASRSLPSSASANSTRNFCQPQLTI